MPPPSIVAVFLANVALVTIGVALDPQKIPPPFSALFRSKTAFTMIGLLLLRRQFGLVCLPAGAPFGVPAPEHGEEGVGLGFSPAAKAARIATGLHGSCSPLRILNRRIRRRRRVNDDVNAKA